MRQRIGSALLAAAVTVLVSGMAPSASFAQPRQSSSVAAAAQDTVPRLLQINGTLKDSAARPVAGVASVTFAIYADQDGGSALWSETQNVIADANGHFATLLGDATANGMPAELFGTGESRWLGITIARQQEMPRVLLASVPYALKAQDAETLGGIPASEYVTAKSLAAANTRATAPIVNNGTTIVSTPQSATTSATAAASQAAIPDTIPQLPIAGYIAVFLNQTQTGDSVIFQSPSNKIGIGTQAPAATLDINGGEILRGGFYEYPEDIATATNGGRPSHSFQWLASAFNSTTKQSVDYAFGFKAVQLGNNTSNPGAKLDLFYGTGGPTGTISDTGLSVGSTGVITFVPSQTFSGSTLNLPASNGPSFGTVQLGGSPFLADYGGNTNTYVGSFAGNPATTAQDNVAIGPYTLQANSIGTGNSALGAATLEDDTTGQFNTAVGLGSLIDNTTGSYNVAIGYYAMEDNLSGNNNIAIGNQAGLNMTSGNNNTYLGAGATGATGISNSTAIGYGAVANISNTIELGGTGSSAPAVGINDPLPSHTLDVADRGTNGYGVFASSTVVGDAAIGGFSSATSGLSNGATFQSASPNGSGVVGANYAGGYGGYFVSNSGGTAAYFSGNVGETGNFTLTGNLTVTGAVNVTGNVSKGGGSFKIDDPIDPANKYLSHSFVESPDMMNIYNGIVTLDVHGAAVITMPDWFSALNRDFRYQLTAIGAPGPNLYVAAKMKGNQFRIAGGKKGQEVSWQVTGIRHDAWADANRIPTEEEKPADEQGKYLHPELYGAGPEKSVAARRDSASPVASPAASPVPATQK